MSSTTIALSEETKDRLRVVKHKIEKKDHRSYSFGSTVDYLLDKEEEDGSNTD